ncbi:hypothetical protein LCGC14_1945370, partial [marine sediment metagenome]
MNWFEILECVVLGILLGCIFIM